MSAPTPNAALAYAVLDHVDTDVHSLMQSVWIAKASCGTVACFAGWTCLLSGDRAEFDEEDENEAEEVWIGDSRVLNYIPSRAAQLLGIEPDGGERTGYRLFESSNTREDLGRLVAEIFGPRPEPCTTSAALQHEADRLEAVPKSLISEAMRASVDAERTWRRHLERLGAHS